MSTSPENSPRSLYQKSCGRDILPIILDSSQSPISASELVEQFSNYNGTLPSAELPSALLSMSNYEKQYSETDNYNFNNDNMYLACAQPGNPQIQGHLPYSHTSNPSYSSYHQSAVSSDTSSNWPSDYTQQLPEIISWSPKVAAHGMSIFIHLRSSFAINSHTMRLRVNFGAVESSSLNLKPRQADGTHYHYTLQALIPDHQQTKWSTYEVPVTVAAQDQAGNIIASLKLEELFTYSASPLETSPPTTRKRRLSDSTETSSEPLLKRVSTMPVKLESDHANRSYTYRQASGDLTHSSPQIGGTLPSYVRPMSYPVESPHGSPAQMHSNVTSAPGLQHKYTPTHGRSYSSSNYTSRISKSPNMSTTTRQMNSTSSASSVNNPMLVRTTQISQAVSPASTPSVNSASNYHNAAPMYPHKAELVINGNLDSMLENWTVDETNIKRRLVQFTRSQTGGTIYANFAPVAPEDRQTNSICISCIWWESKNQFFVTSVDTIFLLESLVAVRFTVEEKNRIRRNLEGYRPQTVSKGRPDSEEFFKLIMGFPNPKPRNIEKDVKVYGWKILALALKKIIGKYSASYASVIPPPMSSYHPQSDISSETAPASPRSIADSGVTYHSPMTATSLPSEVQHYQSTLGNYTSSGMLTNALYAYPQPQILHGPGLSSYATQHPPQHNHQPASWSSSGSLPITTTMNPPAGVYHFGTSHGLDQYHTSTGS